MTDQANTTVSDLLPCPLCGRALMHTASNAQAGIREPYFEHIDSRDCVLRCMMFLDRPDLVAAWNRRATADVTEAMVERACVEYARSRYGDTMVFPRDFSPEEIARGREDMRAALLAALNPPMGR
jgi:hypothetical protein